jgi:hypothetical protein
VWALRKALAAGLLTRGEAWALWPTGHRAPVAVSIARVAVLVLPAKASAALRSAARRLLGRR